MSTYGDPNAVGVNQAKKPLDYAPSAVLGVAGAAGVSRAIRPNVAGLIRNSDQRVKDIDDKIANEYKYRKPDKGKLRALKQDRVRAQSNAAWTRANVASKHTPGKRIGRGALGLAALGGAALTFPRTKKPEVQ